MSATNVDDIPSIILNLLSDNWRSVLSDGDFDPADFDSNDFFTGTVRIAKGDITFSLYRPAYAEWDKSTSKYLVCTYSIPERGMRAAQDAWRVDEVVAVDIYIKASNNASYLLALTARTLMRDEVKRILHDNESKIPYVALAWVTRGNAVEHPQRVRLLLHVNCLRYHPAGYFAT